MRAPLRVFSRLRPWLRGVVVVFAGLCMVALAAIFLVSKPGVGDHIANAAPKTNDASGKFRPTPEQWNALALQQVGTAVFATEFPTEGKITVDEDRATRIFSPFAGRVTKLLVGPGDHVEQDQPLFIVEAADSVETQKDFIGALTALNKANAQVGLHQMAERRLEALVKDRAMPLKDLQEAQANLTAALNDQRSARIALQATRNRLRLLGKTEAEIDSFEQTGVITPAAPVRSPIAGTIIQRGVGPGQYVNAGANDGQPVFVISDTSKVWLVAYIREIDAAKVKRGQTLHFALLSHPGRMFETTINYVATAIDPNTRRLVVRASLDNSEELLKPEMFASVTVVADSSQPSPAIPVESVVYEGSNAVAWISIDGQSIERRRLRLGRSNGRFIQVLEGINPGEQVVTRGSLFLDRLAAAN